MKICFVLVLALVATAAASPLLVEAKVTVGVEQLLQQLKEVVKLNPDGVKTACKAVCDNYLDILNVICNFVCDYGLGILQ